MPVGTLVGFWRQTRLATTALTSITGIPAAYMTARVVAGAAAAKVYIHDTAGTTSASTRVVTLSASAANAVDELGIPIRCKSGTVKIKSTAADAEVYIYIR